MHEQENPFESIEVKLQELKSKLLLHSTSLNENIIDFTAANAPLN